MAPVSTVDDHMLCIFCRDEILKLHVTEGQPGRMYLLDVLSTMVQDSGFHKAFYNVSRVD